MPVSDEPAHHRDVGGLKSQLRTFQLAEDAVDGARASSAAHADVELVGVSVLCLCLCHCVGNCYRECGKALGSMWSVNVRVMFVGGEESRWQETGICIKGQ